MIDYLPKNIPRILINRTIVHPPEIHDDDASQCNGTTDPENWDFRKNYVFDAYLLGYCDVVTRALAHDLFNNNNHIASSEPSECRTSTNKDLQEAELLSTILKMDDTLTNHNADEWSSVQVPKERVFLFPGAQAPPPTGIAEEVAFREIAHCDGCTKRIEGIIQKCIVCFDYDLCKDCYPMLSKTHYDGTHHFTAEAVSSD